MSTKTDREAIIDSARRMLGAKYRRRGRTAFGCDCIGLIAVVAGLADTPYDTIDYRADKAKPGQLRDALIRAGFRLILPCYAQSGDLVTFHHPHRPAIEAHAGILTDFGFIHIREDCKKAQEIRLDGRWLRLIHSAYVFPGVDMPQVTDGGPYGS